MKRGLKYLSVWLFLGSCAEGNEELPKEKSKVANLKKLELTIHQKDYEGTIDKKKVSFLVADLPEKATVKTIEIEDEKAVANRKQGDEFPISNAESSLTITAEDGSTQEYSLMFTQINALEIEVEGEKYVPIQNGLSFSVEIADLKANSSLKVTKLELAEGATSNTVIGQEITATGNKLEIEVSDSSGRKTVYTLTLVLKQIQAIKRVIIEEFSGQDCSNCAVGYMVVKKLLQDYPDNLVAVTIHAGGLSRPEFRISEGQQLWDYFNIPYQPRAVIDRAKNKTVYERGQWAKEVENRIIPKARIGIKVTPSLAGRNLTAKVEIQMTEPINEALKITAYVVENNVVAYQANSSANHSHQHILRSIATKSHLGDPISGSTFASGQIVTHNITSKAIPPIVKIENAKLVVIISKASNDESLNAIQVSL